MKGALAAASAGAAEAAKRRYFRESYDMDVLPSQQFPLKTVIIERNEWWARGRCAACALGQRAAT